MALAHVLIVCQLLFDPFKDNARVPDDVKVVLQQPAVSRHSLALRIVRLRCFRAHSFTKAKNLPPTTSSNLNGQKRLASAAYKVGCIKYAYIQKPLIT